jgi:hypothetical protein
LLHFRKQTTHSPSPSLNIGNTTTPRYHSPCIPNMFPPPYHKVSPFPPCRYSVFFDCSNGSFHFISCFVFAYALSEQGVEVVHLLEKYSHIMKAFPYPYVLVIPHPELEQELGNIRVGDVLRVVSRDDEYVLRTTSIFHLCLFCPLLHPFVPLFPHLECTLVLI